MSEQHEKFYPASPGITLVKKTTIKTIDRFTNEELKEKFMGEHEHSKTFKRVVKCYLTTFFRFYDKSMYEIDIKEVKEFFNLINNSQAWSLSTKKAMFGKIKQFIKDFTLTNTPKIELFDFASLKGDELLRAMGKQQQTMIKQQKQQEFLHFLDSKDSFKWKDEQFHKEAITNKKVSLEPKEVQSILTYLKVKNYPVYLAIRTLIESGMRNGELNSIVLEPKINGKSTTIEEDLKKRILRVIGKKGKKVYYISQELSELLLKFAKGRREIKTESKSLFISDRKRAYTYISYHIKKACKIVGIEKEVSPHTFRRTLNTLRKRMGCSNEEAKILLNHKLNKNDQVILNTGDVNIDSYTLYKREEFLELFDKFNPYKNLKL